MPKISELPALTVPDNSDTLAIVDQSGNITAKITRDDLFNGSALPNDSVSTSAAISSGVVTNAKLSTTAGEPGGTPLTWTPTTTSSGAMTVTVTTNRGCRYGRVGRYIFYSMALTVTFGSTASATVYATLPVSPRVDITGNDPLASGGSGYVDFGAGIVAAFTFINDTDGKLGIRQYTGNAGTIGTARRIHVSGWYEAAS